MSLERQRYLLAEPHPFFSPSGPGFLRTSKATPPEVRRLLLGLGVLELRDADVFERLLLPRFGAQPAGAQRAQRAHLLHHWEAGPSPFSQHAGLCAALRATAFVPVGAERRLCTPAEVLDPRDGLLSYVFGGEPVFPASECAGEAWLSLLAALGMKTRP